MKHPWQGMWLRLATEIQTRPIRKEVLMQPKLSIIIPVYNAERTLAQCLDSVLGQSCRDFELILINDGSRDASLDICRDFARMDQRIRVISQPNRGPGAARNAGLEIARGTYVQFVDADDLLLDGASEKLIQALRGTDLVIAHFMNANS